MQFISLKNPNHSVPFSVAALQGQAPEGGLYVPATLPQLPKEFWQKLATQSLTDLAAAILPLFITEIPQPRLAQIIKNTFNFPVPLTELSAELFLLELFHGPSLSFKDIGVKFLAEILSYFASRQPQDKIALVVATSGDTGSAVAHGFYQVPNIEAYILYPAGKISYWQEQQIATLGKNIHAIAVTGSFDDCQTLVKMTLNDQELTRQCTLTTANSINIGRLLPQMIYYVWMLAQWQQRGQYRKPTLVVPSGNFGNLTAAAYAQALGAPIGQLIAATNSNDTVPRYLANGQWRPAPTQATLANAMDVSNPNNFVRLQQIYHGELPLLRQAVLSAAISDEHILKEIAATYCATQVILDPHTAVGVAVAKQYQRFPTIVAATAHPGKFSDIIANKLAIDVPLPLALQQLAGKEKHCHHIGTDYQQWRNLLLKTLEKTS